MPDKITEIIPSYIDEESLGELGLRPELYKKLLEDIGITLPPVPPQPRKSALQKILGGVKTGLVEAISGLGDISEEEAARSGGMAFLRGVGLGTQGIRSRKAMTKALSQQRILDIYKAAKTAEAAKERATMPSPEKPISQADMLKARQDVLSDRSQILLEAKNRRLTKHTLIQALSANNQRGKLVNLPSMKGSEELIKVWKEVKAVEDSKIPPSPGQKRDAMDKWSAAMSAFLALPEY